MRSWRRILSVAAWLVVLAAHVARAADRPQVVFTIDVESNETFKLPEQLTTVCRDGSPCGLMEVVRLIRARGWSATFFLNVYEHRQFGEPAMRDIAVRLQEAGQDVALHTHPGDAYDVARWGMQDYSLDEQTAIVRDGVRLLQTWTGRPVVAHRTGAYAADENTLLALERNGIIVDSSVFFQHPNTHLEQLGLARNVPSMYGKLRQIPVSVYERDDRPALPMLRSLFAPVKTIRKIDPNWFQDNREATAAIDALVSANTPVIVVFLHSFSLMTGAHGQPQTNRAALEIFNAILDEVGRRQLPVVTMRDLSVQEFHVPPRGADVIPVVSMQVDPARYVWRRTKTLGSANAAVALAAVVVLLAVAVVLWRRRLSPRPVAPDTKIEAALPRGEGSS